MERQTQLATANPRPKHPPIRWDRPKGRVGIRRPIRLQPGRTRYAHPRSDLGSQPATSDENTDGDRRI